MRSPMLLVAIVVAGCETAGPSPRDASVDAAMPDGSCTACTTPAHAVASCEDGACRFRCDRGYRAVGEACVPARMSLLAGALGGSGSADGVGAAARFDEPWGIAVDAAGNVYVADSASYTIRKVTPAGLVTTIAGAPKQLGSTDAMGTSARFSVTKGLALDGAGNLYVADSYNDTIRKLAPDGAVTTIAGATGQAGSGDGPSPQARFYYPSSVAVDRAGAVFVADLNNGTVRKIDPAGVVSTFAGAAGQFGDSDGMGSAARFNWPKGIAIDGAGTMYVIDSTALRSIAPSGVVASFPRVSPFPGTGIAADAAGNVYFSHLATLVKMTPAGDATVVAGLVNSPGSEDGLGTAARLSDPNGLAVDAAGNVYAADTGNHAIRVMSPDGRVRTLAGLAAHAGSVDGDAASARFSTPEGVAVAPDGTVYVVDRASHTVRRMSPDGAVTTIAGLADKPGSDDGSGATARFSSPGGIAVDAAGVVYVADTANHTIRKVTPAGDVTTVAGLAGQAGSADGSGAAARFNAPDAIAVDTSGRLFVADTYNDTIRTISPAGEVQTLAGLAGQAGASDGQGAAARFSYPDGVAVDAAGTVYVADWRNHSIRKITPSGLVTTLAGLAAQAGEVDGVGAAARFDGPRGISVDVHGDVYVADTGGGTLRQVRPSGIVSTLAGIVGQTGVNPSAFPVGLNAPRGIALSSSGRLIVADRGENALLSIE